LRIEEGNLNQTDQIGLSSTKDDLKKLLITLQRKAPRHHRRGRERYEPSERKDLGSRLYKRNFRTTKRYEDDRGLECDLENRRRRKQKTGKEKRKQGKQEKGTREPNQIEFNERQQAKETPYYLTMGSPT
jgi:hypothetical protein